MGGKEVSMARLRDVLVRVKAGSGKEVSFGR